MCYKERALAEQSLSDDGPLDEVLASRFSIDLTREKLQTLRPKIWLNDEVINFYFKLLQERSNKKATRCWCPNSFFWNKLSGGPDRDCSAYSFKEVKRWTFKAKVDLFELDHVVFPMNIGNCHWAMGATCARTCPWVLLAGARTPEFGERGAERPYFRLHRRSRVLALSRRDSGENGCVPPNRASPCRRGGGPRIMSLFGGGRGRLGDPQKGFSQRGSC